MKRLQIIGLCALAMFAGGAMVASTAEALPSWFVKFTCEEKIGTGHFETGGGKCSKLDLAETGDFEAVAGTGTEETATGEVNYSGRSLQVVIKSGAEELKCNESSVTGHTISFKHVWATETFFGCKTALGVPCQNTAKSGEIDTKVLEGWLFYIKEAPPAEAGIFFTAKEGTVFAEFTCATIKIVVASLERTKAEAGESGSCLAGDVSPLDTRSTVYKLGFHENVKKEQEVRKFKYAGKEVTCELEMSVSGGAFKKAAVTSEQENIFSEALEIRV